MRKSKILYIMTLFVIGLCASAGNLAAQDLCENDSLAVSPDLLVQHLAENKCDCSVGLEDFRKCMNNKSRLNKLAASLNALGKAGVIDKISEKVAKRSIKEAISSSVDECEIEHEDDDSPEDDLPDNEEEL